MKTFAILFSLVALVSAVKQEIFKLPQERIAKLEKAGAECIAELNADPGLLAKIGDGTLPNNEAANTFAHCFGMKTALINDNGHILVDKITALLGDHPLAQAYKEEMKKCNEITKENPIATLGEIYHCYIENAPVRFSFQ